MTRIAVVGAGIAGLGAAHALQQAGQQVIVLEERGVPGGRMQTRSRDGFTWDPGAQFMLSEYRYMKRLLAELGIAVSDRAIAPIQGILLPGHGVYYSNVKSPGSILRHPLLSTAAKWRATRVSREAWRHRKRLDFHRPELAAAMDAESLRSWGDREVGREAVDYFLGVFSSSLFFWRPEETPLWVLLAFTRLLSRWQVIVPAGGMGAVPTALAKRLEVRLHTAVRRVETLPDGTARLAVESVAGEESTRSELTVDRVVLAVPTPVMLNLLPDPQTALGPARSACLRSVRYVPSATAAIAYSRPWETRAYGVGVPLVMDHPVSAVGWEHIKGPDRVPPGSGLGVVMSTASYAQQTWDRPAEEVGQSLVAAVDTIYPGSAAGSSVLGVYRWPHAIPLVEPGQTRRMTEAVVAGPAPGSPIFPCGDAWYGPNTELALGPGWRAAAEVLRSLGRPVPPDLSI